MRLKDITAASGETVAITNEWAAQAEARNTTVTGSTWSVCGGLTLGSTGLSGTTATALLAVTGCGSVKNTVTLANGETLVAVRQVKT